MSNPPPPEHSRSNPGSSPHVPQLPPDPFDKAPTTPQQRNTAFVALLALIGSLLESVLGNPEVEGSGLGMLLQWSTRKCKTSLRARLEPESLACVPMVSTLANKNMDHSQFGVIGGFTRGLCRRPLVVHTGAARGQDSLTRYDPCDVAAVLASKPPTKKRRLVLSRCSLLFAEMLRDQIVASCQAEARQKLTVNKAAPSPITITSSASLLSRWHHLQRQAGMQSSDLRLFKAGQPGSQKRFNTTTTRKTHQRSPQLPIVCKVQ